jgi:hypothetical protein
MCSRIDTDDLDVFPRAVSAWVDTSKRKRDSSLGLPAAGRFGMTIIGNSVLECNSIPEGKPRKIGGVRSWPLP